MVIDRSKCVLLLPTGAVKNKFNLHQQQISYD